MKKVGVVFIVSFIFLLCGCGQTGSKVATGIGKGLMRMVFKQAIESDN